MAIVVGPMHGIPGFGVFYGTSSVHPNFLTHTMFESLRVFSCPHMTQQALPGVCLLSRAQKSKRLKEIPTCRSGSWPSGMYELLSEDWPQGGYTNGFNSRCS